MTVTASQVIAVAASQIGYHQPPGQPSKFGTWYGMPRDPWCAMFVSWSADQVGALSIIPKHAYTPSGANWFKAQGTWRNGLTGARRGDLVYFDFGMGRISHVGIVEGVNSDGSITTIEGNTSGTVAGSQRNGGVVARKRRLSYIVGYGRPAYITHGAGSGATSEEDDDMPFTDEDRKMLRAARDFAESAKRGIWNGGADTIDGVVQRFAYGTLPITVHNQNLIASVIGRQAALEEAVRQGGDVDLAAIARAAEEGVARALAARPPLSDPEVSL